MAKVSQLIQVPSLTEQARQLMLAIITLAEKQAATPEGYEDRLHAISMLAREAHNTIADAKRVSAGGHNEVGAKVQDKMSKSGGGIFVPVFEHASGLVQTSP